MPSWRSNDEGPRVKKFRTICTNKDFEIKSSLHFDDRGEKKKTKEMEREGGREEKSHFQ